MEDATKMVVEGQCPHCAGGIVININAPHPTVDILSPDDVDENIKNVLSETQNDYPEEPEAS